MSSDMGSMSHLLAGSPVHPAPRPPLTLTVAVLTARSVYLVRLISIWYCNWLMLFMTLDMPDEGTR